MLTTNDIFRKIKYTYNYNPEKLLKIYETTGYQTNLENVKSWLEKVDTDEDRDKWMPDKDLATFLNGFINEKRGKREGEQPIPEKRLNNNLILRKIKIALNLKDTDILDLLKSVDFNLGKAELSAFFRKPDHKHYRRCQDQILRNFLNALFKQQFPEEKKIL